MSAWLADAGAAPDPLPAAAPPEDELAPPLALPLPPEEVLPPASLLPPDEETPPLVLLPPLPLLLSELEHPSAGTSAAIEVPRTSPKCVNFQKCIQLLALGESGWARRGDSPARVGEERRWLLARAQRSRRGFAVRRLL